MRRPHGTTPWIGLAGVALLVLAAPACGYAAEEPEIAVEASAEEIFLGESVDYVVELRNVKDPSTPDLSALRPDFQVVAAGDESRNQQSTFIINGRITHERSFGHVYRYRLTPRRAGALAIAGPSATVGGKVLTGRALPLKVVAPEEQDLVVPEITLDRSRVFPTQPFEVTLRMLVRPLPDGDDRDPLGPLRRRPPHLEVNWVDPPAGLTGEDKARWLEKLVADDGVGFTLNEFTVRSLSFFDGPPAAVFHLNKGRETRKGRDGRPVNYFVYELGRKLSGEKPGTYSFGPALVKGSFVAGKEGSSYTGRRLVAVAPAATVEVREVPTPRPPSFCGGVGAYQVAASARPTALRVGDPLTLTLEFRRGPDSGSLSMISAPDLAANPRLAADFEVVDRNPTGRSEGDVKRFEYALRPKREGVAIPALDVTVFDPESETFADVATAPIALSVAAASRLGAGDLVGAPGAAGTHEMRSRAQGIFQNVTDPAAVVDERVDVAALTAVAAGSWLAVGCLGAVFSALRRKSGDVAWRRRRSARRTAGRRLAEARRLLAEGRSREGLRALRSALVGLVADLRNVVGEGLTASEADAALAGTAVPADARARFRHVLEAIEAAEYGTGTASETTSMVETAAGLIPTLARHLERAT
jgi:hypothetical protein